MSAPERIDRTDAAAGVGLAVGALLMVIGGAIGGALGGDLFAAMEGPTDEIGPALADVAANRTGYLVNLASWITGIVVLGWSGSVLAESRTDRRLPMATARFAFTASAASGLVFFSLMVGVVVGLAPAHAAGDDVIDVTRAIGMGATTADWVATVLVLVVGGVAVTHLGRDRWVPAWLERWALLVVALGGLTLVGLVVDNRALALPVVPAGAVLLVANGVLIARRHSGDPHRPTLSQQHATQP